MLLIQEVTHWEMSIKQVAIPDQALEFQQCVDSRGFEKITSAPSVCVLCVCVLTEEAWNWNLLMCCAPGVLKVCLSVIACSCVGTFTKCLGVTSAQQICKHCQPVWIGAAALWLLWADEMIVFKVSAHACFHNKENMSAVRNDSEKCNHLSGLSSQGALLCTLLKQWRGETLVVSRTAVFSCHFSA